MDIFILNAPISADILTMTENMIMWTVTNKIKLGLASIIAVYCTLQVIWFAVNAVIYVDVDFIIKYSPMSFNNFYASLAIANILSQHFQFKHVLTFIRNNFWTLDQVEKEARLEILKDMATCKKLMLFTLFLVMSSPVIYLPFRGVDYNNTFFPTIEILNEVNVGRPLKYLATCFNYIILFPQSYFMGMFLFTLSFFVTHYRYQAIMIKWALINITKDLKKLDYNNDIIRNSSCQEIIRNRLVVCVRHHITISIFAKYTILFFYKTFFGHVLGGMSLIATHAYIIVFHGGGSSPVAVIINATAGIFVASLFGYFGEIFQEQTHNILDAAIKTKWLQFNIKNRRTFMILLVNLKRKFQIVAAGLFVIDCEYVIWLYNKIFALLSVLSVMEQK